MKSLFLKIVLCFTATVMLLINVPYADAQIIGLRKKAEIGIRFMPTYSSLNVKTSSGGKISGEATLGFGIGAFVGFSITKHISIQGEFIYNTISQKITDPNGDREITIKYIAVPLLLSLNTGKSKIINLNVVAGPQIGFNAGSNIKYSGFVDENNPQPVLSVDINDYGFAYGAGVDFGINSGRSLRLGLGYRGVLGLVDISDTDDTIADDSYYILDRTYLKTNSLYAGLSLLF